VDKASSSATARVNVIRIIVNAREVTENTTANTTLGTSRAVTTTQVRRTQY
jgi:hypothetical protein